MWLPIESIFVSAQPRNRTARRHIYPDCSGTRQKTSSQADICHTRGTSCLTSTDNTKLFKRGCTAHRHRFRAVDRIRRHANGMAHYTDQLGMFHLVSVYSVQKTEHQKSNCKIAFALASNGTAKTGTFQAPRGLCGQFQPRRKQIWLRKH